MTRPTHPHLSDEQKVYVVVRNSDGRAIDVHDSEPDMSAYNNCTLRVYPTTPPAAAEAPAVPIAWARRWHADGIKPEKINGKWPARFKLFPVTAHKVLEDDVPLLAAQPKADSTGSMSGILESVVESIRQGVADSTEPKCALCGDRARIAPVCDACHDDMGTKPKAPATHSPVNPASAQAGEVLTEERIEDLIDSASRKFNGRNRGAGGQLLTAYDDWNHWLARELESAILALRPKAQPLTEIEVTALWLESRSGFEADFERGLRAGERAHGIASPTKGEGA